MSIKLLSLSVPSKINIFTRYIKQLTLPLLGEKSLLKLDKRMS